MELYSKEELLKELKKEYSCGGECDHCPEVLDAGSCSVLRCIRRIIDNASPVKAFTKEDMAGAYNEGYVCGSRESERKKGEWIKVTKAGTVPVEYICSLCRRKIYDNYELTIPIDEFYPFCHCGADMRKGGAEE